MAEIVNLRRAGKNRARAEKEKTAADNRVRFGTSKRERARGAAQNEKMQREIEAHRLDSSQDNPEDGKG